MTTLALAPTVTAPSSRSSNNLPIGLTVDDAARIAAALDAAHAQSTRILYAHTWRVWERWCADCVSLCSRLPPGRWPLPGRARRHRHRGGQPQHGLYRHPAHAPPARAGQPRRGRARPPGPPRPAPHLWQRPQAAGPPAHRPRDRPVTAIDRTTPIGARDSTIILLGYASARRGSELVALTLTEIETKPGGILVSIRHSKTDQEGQGQIVAVAHGSHVATDPISALAAWRQFRCDHPGALFTRIWVSRIGDQPLGNQVVARMLRQRAVAAGLDGTRITAHSLRAGQATTAAMAGVPLDRIAAQTRHKGLTVLGTRYIRPLEALATTSSKDLGL